MFTRFATASMLGALAALGTVKATAIDASFGVSFGLSFGSSSCQSDQFWYDRLGCCLKNGGESTTPPSGTSCPSNFYWHTTQSCCVPKSSNPVLQIPSLCPSLYIWDILTWSCKPISSPTPTTCGTGFWWGALNTCVPTGGTGYTPPSGYSCPDQWSWLSVLSCCKPNQPTAPSTPSCGNNWLWHPGKQCCIPGGGGGNPTPSNYPGQYARKRHVPVHKRTSFCPSTHDSCPIPGSDEHECLDTRSELTSCGGCSSLGQGQNCLTIPHAKRATCNQGACVVHTCKRGLEVGSDGASCVAPSRAML